VSYVLFTSINFNVIKVLNNKCTSASGQQRYY